MSDTDLFERLMLEVNQAGLSWLTILKKREGFRAAFHGFELERVAQYDDDDRARLMGDSSIIRNRLKIDAAIHNATVIKGFQNTEGSFGEWLDSRECSTRDAWVACFRKTFKFMGPEIVNEFLMSTGYLPIVHDSGCWLQGRHPGR